jgi:hypothetical protein
VTRDTVPDKRRILKIHVSKCFVARLPNPVVDLYNETYHNQGVDQQVKDTNLSFRLEYRIIMRVFRIWMLVSPLARGTV